jgi:oxygen-independent coproporphyrinogen-3 oxidase
VDLIFGLPSHLERSWSDDLGRTLDLDVPHVSVYGLSVESGTPLGRAVAEGRERVADEERYREEFLEAARVLCAAGYEHYEVSNFARGGAASRHNAVYWQGSPYLGLGNGAHSYAHPLRRWNERDWAAYQRTAGAHRLAVAGQEVIDAAQRRLESIWLALRTRRGLGLDALPAGARARAEEWTRSGLATLERGHVVLTPEGWLVLDRLTVELDSLDVG